MNGTERCSGPVLASTVLLLFGLLLGTNAAADAQKITSTIVVNKGQTYNGSANQQCKFSK